MPEFSYSLQINVSYCLLLSCCGNFSLGAEGTVRRGKKLGPLFLFNPLWPTPLTVYRDISILYQSDTRERTKERSRGGGECVYIILPTGQEHAIQQYTNQDRSCIPLACMV
jgi:hypothetical protein